VPGTFSCSCHPGYKGTGLACEEINGCLSNPCDIHANCTKNGPGTYACDCFFGYSGDGLHCDVSNAMQDAMASHDDHLQQIEKLQQRLAELEQINPHKKKEFAQQKEIQTVKESLAKLEQTASQLIKSTDQQREAIKAILSERKAAQGQQQSSLLETNNNKLKKIKRAVPINDEH